MGVRLLICQPLDPGPTTGESVGASGIFFRPCRPCRPGARASRALIPIPRKKTFRKRRTRMNKIRLGRASPRCAGYFWRAAGPAVAIARAMSVVSQSAKSPRGRSRDGWQLRGPGRVRRHQCRPQRPQREPRREPRHSRDRVRPWLVARVNHECTPHQGL
jgi:hypothetical protein